MATFRIKRFSKLTARKIGLLRKVISEAKNPRMSKVKSIALKSAAGIEKKANSGINYLKKMNNPAGITPGQATVDLSSKAIGYTLEHPTTAALQAATKTVYPVAAYSAVTPIAGPIAGGFAAGLPVGAAGMLGTVPLDKKIVKKLSFLKKGGDAVRSFPGTKVGKFTSASIDGAFESVRQMF